MLARTVAHTTDVDGMLDSMEPRQFNEWFAEYKIQPWGIEPSITEPEENKGALATMRAAAGV